MDDIKKKNIYFAAGILLLLAFLFLISGAKKPPPLPPDSEHSEISSNEDCLPCHGPDSDRPLSGAHPPKNDCILCHVENAMKRGPIKYKIIQKIKKEKSERQKSQENKGGSHGFQ